jgi:uncharacterized protein (TIGR03435 family)
VFGEQIQNAPDWIGQDRYQIEIKSDSPASDSEMTGLLRSVLENAFALRVHREQRDSAAYALVIGKSGPKFHATTAGSTPTTVFAPGHITFGSVTALVSYLNQRYYAFHGSAVDRPIVDNTGLGGAYEIGLDVSSEAAPDGPPLMALVKEQLGLDFVPANSKIEYLRVENIAKLATTWTSN